MQDRREYILNKAFEVFISVGYDSASMTVLQQQLKMSRGAMYRYYESKDDLFIAVIDKYVFGMMDYVRLALDEEMTIQERIDKHCNQVKTGQDIIIEKIGNISIKFLNFSALMIQAAKIYPGFVERMIGYKKLQRNGWIKAIENSIAKGEIRPDTNVAILAALFAESINLRNNIDELINSSSNTANNLRDAMNYIYSLVKT
jgi:AcrR family transcriptional regulator